MWVFCVMMTRSRRRRSESYKREASCSTVEWMGTWPPEAQEVSCEPEIRIRERKETDRMLVLACDGVWDVWRDLDAFRTELFEYIVEFNKRTDLEKGSEAGGCPEFLPGSVFGARQHRQYEPIGDTTRQLEMFLNKQAKHARASTSSATASASSYPSLRPQPWSSCSR